MFVLTERIPIDKALYLYEMKFPTFKQYVKRCKNDIDRKEQYNKVLKLCKEVIDNLGSVERHYDFSAGKVTEGRLFSVNGGVQGIMREIRGFLLSHTTDLDIQNAHPRILNYICKKHNIPCPNLEYYINNRDSILNEFDNREIGKDAFLKSLNNDKINKNITLPAFRKFDVEIKKIQKAVIEIPEYKDISDKVDEKKNYNLVGSKLNNILCYYENEVLQVAANYLKNNNYELASFMFDGCNIYGDLYDNNELLTNLNDICNKTFEGINIIWTFKKHEKLITIPDGWKPNLLAVKEKKKVEDVDEKKIHSELLKRFIPFEFMTRTEGTIQFIKKYHPDKFMWVKGKIYCWNGIQWEKNSNEFIRFLLSDSAVILDGILEEATAKLNVFNEIERKVLTEIQDIIKECKFYYKDFNYASNVIKASIAFFSRDDIEFDSNVDLLGFNNGVYDLIKHEFRPYKYDDYMIMRTGYDYNPYVDPAKAHDVEMLLEKIMPIRENRELLLEVLSAGLTGRCIEKFIMLNGGGRNGKGLINEFMMIILGDYQFIYANSCLLTDEKKAGPNPELASIDKKRYVAYKEPNSNMTLNNDSIKDITGGGNVSARNCYSNETLVRLDCINVLECNDRAKLNSEPTNAEFERLIDIEFPNRFTTLTGEVDNVTVFMGDAKFKTMEWKLEHRDAFVQILIKSFKNLQSNNYIFSIPASVQLRSNEYLNGSFPILEIFYEKYERTGVDTDIIKLKDICDVIKYSESYNNFDKKQKRKYNNKYISTFIEKHRDLRKYYRDRLKVININYYSVLVGYKLITDGSDGMDFEVIEENI